MKHIENLLAVALGVSTIVGGIMLGCGGDIATPTGGNGGSSVGGDGSGGNPSSSSSSSGNPSGSGGMMAGPGGAAGSGGAAGAGGMAGSGNMGGSGGSGGCTTAADCSDGFNCTIDSCNAGTCEHVVGPNSGATACPAGKVCQLGLGCVDLVICADDAQCIMKLGGDACKANIHCDLATSICKFSPLDKDNDGQPPIVCAGTDCDDNNNQTYAGAMEYCDGKDNNCNGTTDENAQCPGLATCQAGACTCPAQNACGVDCVDKMTSNTHCGQCNNPCLGAASCMNGQCVCPGGATTCGGVCIDTKTDPQHCGGCGKTCAPGYSCVNSFCTCLGTPCGTQCINTMNDPSNCGGCNVVCPAGTTCQNGTCLCPMGQTACNSQCINTMTNPNHCGGCNMPCPAGASCQNGFCTCPVGQTACSGQCVDTMTNAAHCGGCSKPCNGVCQNGMCTPCSVANLYLFADLSGSMTETVPSGGTRFDAMRNGINAFLTNPLSANMGAGLGYHPISPMGTGNFCYGTNIPCVTDTDCSGTTFPFCFPASGSDSCVVADYVTPPVPIALLPGNQMAITNSLAMQTANAGSTPPPGYQGALQYAKNFAMANPTQKVAVVLMLDSLPRICNTNSDVPDDLLPIAQQFATGTPKVLTYVLGIGPGISPDPTLAQLNQVAMAGGTGTAYLANSTTDVTNALNSIRTQFKTCP